MARTTDEQVRTILGQSTADVTAAIEVATALVDEHCSSVESYDAAALERIERFLAAHFFEITEPKASMEKAGPVSQSFDIKNGLALNQTRFGQQAMFLDSNGNLARHNKSVTDGLVSKFKISHLGRKRR